MVSNTAALKRDWAYATTFVGRLFISAIFLISGVGKVMAPAPVIADIESVGLPLPPLALATAIAIELLCGAALVVGFKVRWAAGILAAFTLTTGLIFHSAFGDPNQLTHFLKNVAVTGGLLYVIAFGNATGR